MNVDIILTIFVLELSAIENEIPLLFEEINHFLLKVLRSTRHRKGSKDLDWPFSSKCWRRCTRCTVHRFQQVHLRFGQR